MKTKLKILIVDDDINMAHTLADILAISGYLPLEANSAPKALDIIKEKQVDCVLTDVRMGGMSGVELFEEIQKIKPDLPVVMMTAYAPDDQIRHGLKIGALGLLTKPLEINLLLNFLTILSNEHCIAIVDDDPAFCKTLAEILTRRGYNVKIISDPNLILKALNPQVQSVLLDMKLNGADGQDVLAKIREKYDEIPVILITAYRQEMSAAIEKALALDAFACLYKPLDIPKLIQTLDEILKTRLKDVLEEK
jgi:DNA-binding NtrC family response regulator